LPVRPLERYRIPLLLPDMPKARDLMPWLERIDAACRYTNFGPLATEFESWLAAHWVGTGVPPAVIATSSGTAALELGLRALDLPHGAHVLLPALTFPATASVVLRCGLVPVLADVDPDTWLLTPALARQAARTYALALIMPVASYGNPVDVASWDALAAESGIPVLIDAAAAFGNQKLGRHVHAAFSLHATKPFGIGEGGALVTRDANMAARVRSLSNFGFAQGVVVEAGMNAKLSEYAAAVGLAQSLRWPAVQARRRELWRLYAPLLAALPGLRLQHGFASDAVPAKLMVRLPMPAQGVAQALRGEGIETRSWYLPPLHRQPAFAHCPRYGREGVGRLSNTEALAGCALGLPWFAALTAAQCVEVVAALARVFAAQVDRRGA